MPVPSLNWREIEVLARNLRSGFVGRWVDRVFIPQRPFKKEGFLRGEVALRFRPLSGAPEGVVVNLRPSEPYLFVMDRPDLGSRTAASEATKSAFIQMLAKYLAGAKCVGVESVARERMLMLWFHPSREARGVPEERLGLLLTLKPAKPEGILVSDVGGFPVTAGVVFKVLGSSREAEPAETVVIPDGRGAPENPEIRYSWTESEILTALTAEGQSQALEAARRLWRERQSQAKKVHAQAQATLRAAQAEPDWDRYGEIVKANLSELGSKKRREKTVELEDYTRGERVEIPWNPKSTPQDVARDFFQKARQKRTRLEEATSRMTAAEGILKEPEPSLEDLDKSKAPARGGDPEARAKASLEKSYPKAWKGKVFFSSEGFPILVGRNQKENLELTTRIAKGNDLWFHLRGRPGAHVVIILPKGKTASLESLLDAATLTLHFSGGTEWGKTDVDYTFRKFVKRIKDSTEVSYTQNKTLVLEVEQDRLKALLARSQSERELF